MRRQRKPFWLSLAAAMVLLCAAAQPSSALDFPVLSGRVVDSAGILGATARDNLVAKLTQLEAKTTDQLVVATVGSLLEATRFRAALQEAMRLAALANQYLAEQTPWTKLEASRERAATILFVGEHAVFAVYGGQPFLRERVVQRNPLGPLQNWGDAVRIP